MSNEWWTENLWWMFGLASGAAILIDYALERLRERKSDAK